MDETIEVQLDFEYVASCGCKVLVQGSDRYEQAKLMPYPACDIHAGKRLIAWRRETRNQLIATARGFLQDYLEGNHGS